MHKTESINIPCSVTSALPSINMVREKRKSLSAPTYIYPLNYQVKKNLTIKYWHFLMPSVDISITDLSQG